MSDIPSDNTPILRLELKRADAAELVRADHELSSSAFVRALGSRAGEVLAAGTVRRYPDRVVVFQQNDSGTSLFFVLAGEARIYSRKFADAVELGMAHKGDVVGEGEVLSGKCTRSASVIAHGQLDLVEVHREGLLFGHLLPKVLHEALEAISLNRTARLDEMSDFLNRW